MRKHKTAAGLLTICAALSSAAFAIAQEPEPPTTDPTPPTESTPPTGGCEVTYGTAAAVKVLKAAYKHKAWMGGAFREKDPRSPAQVRKLTLYRDCATSEEVRAEIGRKAEHYRKGYAAHVAKWKRITPFPGPVGAGGQKGTSYWAVDADIVSCETGGTFNQFAYNEGSGASGWYQSLGHSCFAWDAKQQHICGHYILSTEGTGAWSQCGG